MIGHLKVGSYLLEPLVLKEVLALGKSHGPHLDAVVTVAWDDTESARFGIEIKSRSTPQMLDWAITQVKSAVMTQPGLLPMIFVPYLSEERIAILAREMVSGIDLCGNGIIVIQRRMTVRSVGKPNLYKERSPILRPFAGRSAIVCRVLLQHNRWETLGALHAAILQQGETVSLASCSKVVSALAEELIVRRENGIIMVQDRLRILDGLGGEWAHIRPARRQAVHLPPIGPEKNFLPYLAERFKTSGNIRWMVGGSSSAPRYTMLAQAGPREITVSNLNHALTCTQAKPDAVAAFADVVFTEYDAPGIFIDSEKDEQGVSWASPLQTWLELQSGDARQIQTAADVRRLLTRKDS